MKALLTCIVLFFSIIGQSQTIVEGKIIQGMNGEPLSYVSIGIVGKNLGTLSNREGTFKLKLPNSLLNDTMRVSIVGFETQNFTVSEFIDKVKADYNIAMKESKIMIEEIFIVDSKMKRKVFGNQTQVQWFSAGFGTDTLGNEMALKIKSKSKSTVLKTFNLSIVINEYDLVRFRINFYDIKRGKPGKLINKQNIIIETTIKNGLLSFDLTPYNIVMDESFFLSIEWLEDYGEQKELKFSAKYPAKSMYYRSASHGSWRKITSMFGIGMNVVGLQ